MAPPACACAKTFKIEVRQAELFLEGLLWLQDKGEVDWKMDQTGVCCRIQVGEGTQVGQGQGGAPISQQVGDWRVCHQVMW